MDGDFFWNIHEFWEVESMQDDARGAHVAVGCAPDPRGNLVRRLLPFFCRKKANIREHIVLKVSFQSDLWISENIRNRERAESGAQK